VLLEPQEVMLQFGQGSGNTRRQRLALHDQEVELYLIKPAGKHGGVNGYDGGSALAQVFGTPFPPGGRNRFP
jgi:hypothetical protein